MVLLGGSSHRARRTGEVRFGWEVCAWTLRFSSVESPVADVRHDDRKLSCRRNLPDSLAPRGAAGAGLPSEVRRFVIDVVVGRVLTAGGGEVVAGLVDATTGYLPHRYNFGWGAARAGACIRYALSCNLSDRVPGVMINRGDRSPNAWPHLPKRERRPGGAGC